VQFHLRDQESADRELNELLAAAATAGGGSAAGGLLFTCNGRGSQMFDIEHHDAAAVDRYFPDLPLAGFFAQGEIGPIGGRSFMHGFTASLALLEDAAK
jgi:small ligand-binding sensory domain FIST